ncbi:Sapep family Mn(2+)-dependent dipeptidase [Ruminococcaceae bacterium OttesenSCG-928-A16]|nr:Sapep family Mn(2+)-dependent dipeptidase [Ruminococcaceae bacterium OttesenSCG-928-A16]
MQLSEKQLNQKIEEFIEANRAPLVADIARLIAVRSVEEAPLPGAPFGEGPKKALETALQIGKDLGFEPHNCDNYVGWIELAGQEEGHIATVTHVDVVPEGEGWSGDAYTMRQRDGFIIGRGVADDKGPSVLCLYLAKFFKELGVPLRYSLRILLGAAEETGMTDIPYYLERNPQPLFCFSPDSEFPVCNGEKGHLNGVFASPKLAGNIVAFSGGIATNAVPSRATCLVKGQAAALASTSNVSVTAEDGMVRLNAEGVGGHAAFPQGSVNAIALLVEYLLENNLCTAEENQYLQLLRRLHAGTDGSGVGIACRDDAFDALTVIGGVISFEQGQLRQVIDCRFPTATTGEKLEAILKEQAVQAGASFEDVEAKEPFYIPADNPAIQTLLQAYNEVTGQNKQAFTMGGGTYARCFNNAVSFGPEEPEAKLPSFAGPMHGADEAASIDGLLDALKIYILAVWRLQKVDLG